MSDPEVQRRLAAILAADVAGYTRLMEANEEATLSAWWAARKDVIDPTVTRHRGRIVKHTGDGFLAEFPTATEAVQCAISMQTDLVAIHSKTPKDRRFAFRMGINLGEIVADKDDIYGEGVNLAARLEGLAEPGGICISEDVYRQVRNKLSIDFQYLGEKRLKNISEVAAVYHVSFGKRRRDFFAEKVFGRDRGVREDQPPAPKRINPSSEEPRERLLRHVKVLSVFWALLVFVDIITGAGIWVHWPGIVFATILGIEAVLLNVSGWRKRMIACYAVIIVGLTVINLITWPGYLWVLWPAAPLIIVEFIRRSGFAFTER
jgi:adenylate cyclase